MSPSYRSEILAHLGLVAGMFDALGLGAVIDQATPQHPATRMVTVGKGVKAMVLNGLGLVNQPRYLVPWFCQHQPMHRLMAPGIETHHRHDDTLGHALDTLYDYGVTALYRLMVVTAATRLGVAPQLAHLDRTSFPVDGRDNSAEDPEVQVLHITRGYRRDHRPALKQVMLDLIVAPQAGIPRLMKPLRGHTSDASACGRVVTAPSAQRHMTSGPTYLVAESALSSAEHLQPLAHTGSRWITRVPATFTAAPQALPQAPRTRWFR
jgi:transposase